MTNSNFNIPNIVSGIALLFAWLAIISILKNEFYLSYGLILLAFVFDALDGYLARLLKTENQLGRALDGYVDVINYLIYPAITFFTFFKLNNEFSVLAIFVFLAAGVFRLARFEVRGIKKQEGKMYYEGLPVFFSPIIILLFLITTQFVRPIFPLFAVSVLLITSLLMIQTFKFPKPKNVLPILLAVLILSFIFFAKQFSLISW